MAWGHYCALAGATPVELRLALKLAPARIEDA
jgi:hypothetical protein